MQRGLALRRQRCKELQGLVVVLERKEEDHHSVLLSEIIKAGFLQYAQRLAPVPDGEELPFQDRWLKKSDPSARKLLTDLKRWASEPDPPEDKPADSSSTVPDASTQDSNTSQNDTVTAVSDQKQKDSKVPGADVSTPNAACDSKEPAVVVDDSQELIANKALNQTKPDFGTGDADISDAAVQAFTHASTSKPNPGNLWDFQRHSSTRDPVNPKGKQSQHAVHREANSPGQSSVIEDAPSAPEMTLITNQVKKHSGVAASQSPRPEVRKPQAILQQSIFPQIQTKNKYSSFPSTVTPPIINDHMPAKTSPDTVVHPSISQAKQQTPSSPSSMVETGNQRPIFPPVNIEAERKRLRPVVPPIDIEGNRNKMDN
ncbi:hypothetical protein GQ607_017737 [Colletotrichum asianum]|uniref:Uncharacterized protein n=1 Tax=Colletotrichum asianum TaxID=702518 RepID=A0A8H3VYI8_9PEZI|nr:hypothetical protein GQ607_017737 [Colletotrichum asianum]